MPSQRFMFFISLSQKPKLVNLPAIKVAVLVDGGFFIKRYNALFNKDHTKTPEQVCKDLVTIALGHVGNNNFLYRIFYYDCLPLTKRVHNPISKKCIDFAKNPEAIFRNELFENLKKQRKCALRLGYLSDSSHSWSISKAKQRDLLAGKITMDDVTETDVFYDLNQKGIDMKIGVDIASLSFKGLVDRMVLISGDADFVPAAKLARREGIDFVLDPMGANIDPSLFEHIDGIEQCPLMTKHKK